MELAGQVSGETVSWSATAGRFCSVGLARRPTTSHQRRNDQHVLPTADQPAATRLPWTGLPGEGGSIPETAGRGLKSPPHPPLEVPSTSRRRKSCARAYDVTPLARPASEGATRKQRVRWPDSRPGLRARRRGLPSAGPGGRPGCGDARSLSSRGLQRRRRFPPTPTGEGLGSERKRGPHGHTDALGPGRR